MTIIRLIHWNVAEAQEKAKIFRTMGYEVVHTMFDPDGMKELRQYPPDAIVIDLSRLPSQGRDLGMNIRKYKTTRHVPLIFIGGEEEKIKRIREVLPDAAYTSWDEIQHSLEYALANPPAEPVTPKSVFDVYQGVPLQKKLGFKPHIVVALIDAPLGFADSLGGLPSDVTIRSETSERVDLVLWFVQSREELNQRIEKVASLIGDGRIWIIWPKKTSKIKTDLSQVVVRKVGLDSGLVDFKICSIDDTWSGLCFTQRKQK